MQFLEPSLDLVDRFERRVHRLHRQVSDADIKLLDNSLETFLCSARFFGCADVELRVAGAHQLLRRHAGGSEALSHSDLACLLSVGDTVRAMFRRLRGVPPQPAPGEDNPECV